MEIVPVRTALPIRPALEGHYCVSAIKVSRVPTVGRAEHVLLEHTRLHTDGWPVRRVHPGHIHTFHQLHSAGDVQKANFSEQKELTLLMPARCVHLAHIQI